MLSETVSDASLIQNIWVEPAIESLSPMEPLKTELGFLDRSLEQVFLDFAVRNVDWNYEHGSAYSADLERVPVDWNRMVTVSWTSFGNEEVDSGSDRPESRACVYGVRI